MATGRVDVLRRRDSYNYSKREFESYRNGVCRGDGVKHKNGFHLPSNVRNSGGSERSSNSSEPCSKNSKTRKSDCLVQLPPEKKRKFSPIIWDGEEKQVRVSSKNRLVPVIPLSPAHPTSVQNVLFDGVVSKSPVMVVKSREVEVSEPSVADCLEGSCQSEAPADLSTQLHSEQSRQDEQAKNNMVHPPNISLSRWASDSDSPRAPRDIADDPCSSPESGEIQREGSGGSRTRVSSSDEESSFETPGEKYYGEELCDKNMNIDKHDGNAGVGINQLYSDSESDSEDDVDLPKIEEPAVPMQGSINMLQGCRSVFEYEQNLKIAALALRSVTDIFYIMDIIIEIYTYKICSSLTIELHHISKSEFLGNTFLPTLAKKIWQSYILIDILAILPLPQVLLLNFFSRMAASRSSETSKFIMNFFVLMQYIPRVIRIYLSCEAPKKSPRRETPIWVKGVLNFFMYILASHILGAIWYFFAIQRMTACWQYACQNENGCDPNTFGCHYQTFKDDLCPISSPNATIFDFGIFLSILQSGVPSSTNFLQKFSNCFCWGLRNLSSLGSNLQPSTRTWENLFVVFISITGLLLFIYLIGNLQTYLSLDTTRIQVHRHKMKIKRKMEAKGQELELWLPKNGIPRRSQKDIKLQIMEKVEQEFEENRNVDLDNFLPTLPMDLENQIKSCMPLTRLKKVRVLQNMDEQVLKAICQHLKPMKYSKNNLILREGEPLKMMIFIVEGHVAIEKKGGSISLQGARELCGENLLAWPFSTSFPQTLPTATETARVIGDVEALILMASDMKSVVFKFGVHFIKKYGKLKEKLVNLHLGPVDTTPTYVEGSHTIFTAQELKKATKNYHESTRVGEGACGIVYKGLLPDKRVVAIKKSMIIHSPSTSVNSVNEALILSQINHRNIVKLLGCCLEAKTSLMVYEFTDKGSLYHQMHKEGIGSGLSFELRTKIAAETARALAYLHAMSIIHRDLKTTNILLDKSYAAKVAGFRASRLVHEDHDQISTLVQGTLGYLDPEYIQSATLTEKSDVYSFGVVLLELLTSQKAVSFERSAVDRYLANFFLRSMERGHLVQILDGEIINVGNFGTAEKVSYLAKRCLKVRGEERPCMKEVAAELEGIMRSMEKHPGGKANFSRSPKETECLLGSSSNAYVVDVRGEGDDAGSSGIIISAENDKSMQNQIQMIEPYDGGR